MPARRSFIRRLGTHQREHIFTEIERSVPRRAHCCARFGTTPRPEFQDFSCADERAGVYVRMSRTLRHDIGVVGFRDQLDRDLIGVEAGRRVALESTSDGGIQPVPQCCLRLVLGALDTPVELAGLLEHHHQVLVAEVGTHRQLEGRAADHQLEHCIDALGSGQHVPLALPGMRPDVRSRPDHVLAHLELLLGAELRQRRAPRHERREGDVKTLHVDPGRPMAPLVGPLVGLLQDDHVLERTPRVVGKLHAERVGSCLGLGIPLPQLVLQLELQTGVELATPVLLKEHHETSSVGHPDHAGHEERPSSALLGVEQLESATSVLTIVEDDVRTRLVVQLAIAVLPAVLERPLGVLGEGGVRLQHGLRHVEGVGLVEATVDTELGLAEPLHATQLHQLVRAQVEGVEDHITLRRGDHGLDHPWLLGAAGGDVVGQGQVVGGHASPAFP